MKLVFDSVEEVRNFVKEELKGARRGGKDDNETGAQSGNTAPAPLAPPAGQAGGFAPGGTSFATSGPVGGGFPGPVGVAPEVAALVNRIVPKIDGAITSGQPADQVLSWFRGRCGAEAAQATLDQIKTVFLPKLSIAGLTEIAGLMNA